MLSGGSCIKVFGVVTKYPFWGVHDVARILVLRIVRKCNANQRPVSPPPEILDREARIVAAAIVRQGVWSVRIVAEDSVRQCLCGRHRQAGSLAGAVHLLNDNAGVPR